jgi:hypothetical protein
MKSFAQAFIVLLNVCMCLMLMYAAVNCGSSSQRIFDLYEYPPYLNQSLVTLLLAVSAFLAFVCTVFIIKKKAWALNAIVVVYAFLMFLDGRIDYFYLGLIAVHAMLYYPLQKLYRE